jgi:hypothetical protein
MSDKQPKASRRGFFVGAAAASAAVAAVTALPKLQQAQPTAVLPKAAPAKGGGYSLSEHVKRYYQTTLV